MIDQNPNPSRCRIDSYPWRFLTIDGWHGLPLGSRIKILASIFLTPLTLPFTGRSPEFNVRYGPGEPVVEEEK